MPIAAPKLKLILAAAATVLVIATAVWTKAAVAQEDVTSYIRRYREREVSTGYYEQYEVKPTGQRPLVGVPGISRGIFPYSPAAAQIRIRRRLPDAHSGIRFYEFLTCDYCHPGEALSKHTVRNNISCRQCHGGEPIASNEHFYSPLNPIRRHAYVCAKCHEGSSASFSSYVIHEPPPANVSARSQFPLLFYTYWFMLILLIGTLGFFIPHAFLIGIREFVALINAWKRKKIHDGRQD